MCGMMVSTTYAFDGIVDEFYLQVYYELKKAFLFHKLHAKNATVMQCDDA
jgi:hypothetical protein